MRKLEFLRIVIAGLVWAGMILSPLPILPAASDLWVDVVSGNNANDGHSSAAALRTIQRAADLAVPGTTIHILPGVYRETITPAQNGLPDAPIRYLAEAGPGSVAVRGSEPSAGLNWVRLTSNTIGLPPGVDPANIYYADLSSWGLGGAPRFVVTLDANGAPLARLPQAREPDWQSPTTWKHHEFWWAADGGSAPAACNPPTDPRPLDCDAASQSLTQLTDQHNDSLPGIEPGNLTTLGNLTGAKLAVIDTQTGTFMYLRTIIAHDVPAGRITVDRKCEHGFGTNDPALGWGSKYYVEGLPRLLDNPGEWWYDPATARLYLWPPASGSPAAQRIEISRRSNGFMLQNRSYLTIDGLTFEYYNQTIVYARNNTEQKARGNTIRRAILRYGDIGLWLSQQVDPNLPADRVIDGFTLEDSEVAYMDNKAFYIYSSWGSSSSSASFTRPGVTDVLMRGNELHHLGFYTDEDGVGAMLVFMDHFRFINNHVHDVAHNGIQLFRAVDQSTKTYGFLPSEIKTGDILIANNLFEQACQNATDCAGLKIAGSPPNRQVFRNLLITGNILRNSFGWSYIAQQRGHFDGGPGSLVQGRGGFGLYVDNASGVHVYRNIAYNDAFAGFKLSGAWRDGDILYFNNTIANSLYGFHFGGKSYDEHDGSVNTRLVNNILVNNESYAIFLSDADGVFENTILNNNLYFSNGWRSTAQGGDYKPGDIRLDVPGSDLFYQTLADIRAASPWEDDGIESYPGFVQYNPGDHDPTSGAWPDFHLSTASVAIDRGAALPASLAALVTQFGVPDPRGGKAWDIGRYEAGYALAADRTMQAISPGGTARYILSLVPTDLPYPVSLSVASPDPHLTVALQPSVISSTLTATLIVTDSHPGPILMPGVLYTIVIHANGAGYGVDTPLTLMVGGVRLYLPKIMRMITPPGLGPRLLDRKLERERRYDRR